MSKKMMIVAAALMMSGCATGESEDLEKPRLPGDIIRFSAGRCFGTCPAYSLRVTPDGSGLIEPERFTNVPGPTRFAITPAQYRRFRSALSVYRPLTGTTKRIAQGENCDRFATDMPSYAIEWTREQAKATRLEYQSGCMDARYGKLRATIASIPRMLDVESMVKPDSSRKK